MGQPCANLEEAVREAGLSAADRKRVLELLGLLKDIPRFMVLRLLRFLRVVRLGRFGFLSTVEKTALLENFLYLIRGRQEATVREICHLFFEEAVSKEPMPESQPSLLLPRAMTDTLIDVLTSERTETIREAAWRILAGREMCLASLISPSQVISALWSENPLFRNNIVKFMFQHFNPADIAAALSRYTSATGRTLPPETLKRVIAMGGSELKREKRKSVLANLLMASDRGDEGIEDIWSDFLKGLTRFDLIRTFQVGTVEMSWVEDLKKSCQGPSTEGKGERLPHAICGFHTRIARIRKNAQLPPTIDSLLSEVTWIAFWAHCAQDERKPCKTNEKPPDLIT